MTDQDREDADDLKSQIEYDTRALEGCHDPFLAERLAWQIRVNSDLLAALEAKEEAAGEHN